MTNRGKSDSPRSEVATKTGRLCRCDHDWWYHDHSKAAKPCQSTIDTGPGFLDFKSCPCKAWDGSNLPAKGERLEFGKHWMNDPDAEAEAWPVRESDIRRTIRKAAGLR